MPKLTPPTGATSSPGGSGVSKEVGGGTGQGKHDLNGPPSSEHTETTQQRDGGHPKGDATKAAVNPLANLKGKAADQLCSSNLTRLHQQQVIKYMTNMIVTLQARNGRLFGISDKPSQSNRSNCHPNQGEAGKHSGFATMRSTTKMVLSAVG